MSLKVIRVDLAARYHFPSIPEIQVFGLVGQDHQAGTLLLPIAKSRTHGSGGATIHRRLYRHRSSLRAQRLATRPRASTSQPDRLEILAKSAGSDEWLPQDLHARKHLTLAMSSGSTFAPRAELRFPHHHSLPSRVVRTP